MVMLSTTKEKENYNCIMEIMNVGVCEGLREIFKQEWDKHYGTTKGIWDDTCISGNQLYNMERTRPHAKRYLPLYKSGKRSEWDLSALSDAILYSNAIKKHLRPHFCNKVDELRSLRNSLTHSFGSQHKMTDRAFEGAYKKIKSCFKVLKLSTDDVERIKGSSKGNRWTRLWEVRCIIVAVFIAGVISRAFFLWATRSLKSKRIFTVLPARPVHLIANRNQTVEAILKELHILSTRNSHALTYIYISGNPGSGKSQLARLVGQRYKTNIPYGMFGSDTFVMTLNGRSLKDIYKSYVIFARRINCNANKIASIINSNQTGAQMKIENLKAEIAKMLKKYTWLLIVDNVVKLREISSLLPQLEDTDWQGGQVLITTQDASSVPPNSSLIVHISVSQGMEPQESCEFLTDLSGLAESYDLVSNVAKELDYQPLALASAAFYVKQLRESKVSPQFTWKEYLKKLDQGKRNLTEMKLREVNQAYSLTMSSAVLLAVKMIAESDLVVKHAFTFFSYVSYEAIPLQSVVSFVLRVGTGKDKEDVGLRIRQCSLFLSSDHQKAVLISMHRVVHDSIKTYIASNSDENTNLPIPLYVLQSILQQRRRPGATTLIRHLSAFCSRTNDLALESLVPGSMIIKQKMQKQIFRLSSVLVEHGEFLLSKNFLTLAVKMAKNQRGLESLHISFPKIGQIYSMLGEVEGNFGNFLEASKFFNLALDVFLKQHEPSHIYIKRCYLNLWILSCLSPQGCSEELKVSEEERKSLSDENQGLYYHNLGKISHVKGNLIQAEKRYWQADEAYTRAMNEHSTCPRQRGVRVAALWSNLGAVYLHRKNYKLAKALFEGSINMYQLSTGKKHIGLGCTYNNMAIVHSELNELTQAENCLRRALEIYSKQLGPSHEEITRVLTELMHLFEKTGRFNEAADLQKHIVHFADNKDSF